LSSATVSAEDVGFPFAAQAARLLRQTQGRQDEEVTLITSASVKKLPAQLWLKLNRQGWEIESGLHQRLDVSYNDDRCRIQNPKTMLIVGMFRRLANSLFMEWRHHQPHPEYLTTTDFQTALGEEHYSKAIDLVLNGRPSLKNPS
jgi:predicted transposase YbfD/YdcC